MAHKIDYTIAIPADIEAALGKRLGQLRLSKNINQSQLAAEAGVSRRTITRIENGEGSSMETLIRVMQALRVADHLQALLPDPAVRPIERVRMKGKQRQRARPGAVKSAAPWQWRADEETGEEPAGGDEGELV